MRKLKTLFFILLIYMVISSNFATVLSETSPIKTNNIIISSVYRNGFYGSFISEDEFHFLFASKTKDHTYLNHYIATENDVSIYNQIAVDRFYVDNDNYLTLASANQDVFFVYEGSNYNESTQLINHKYYCYTFNPSSDLWNKFTLMDVTEETQSSRIIGVDSDKEGGVFLIYYSSSTNTIFKIITLTQNNNFTISELSIPLELHFPTSCYLKNKDVSYFLFQNNETNYPLYQFNYTTLQLTNIANCSFDFSPSSNPSFGLSKLIYDENNESIYYLCPMVKEGYFDFSLFKLNSTDFSFNLVSSIEDIHAYYGVNEEYYFCSNNKLYRTAIQDSKLYLFTCSLTPHSDLVEATLCECNLVDGYNWSHTSYQSDIFDYSIYNDFLFNITSSKYLDSYIIGYIKKDGYHTISSNNVITSIGIYGTLFGNTKPYLIGAMKSTNFWLLIIITASALLFTSVFGIHFIRKHKKIKQEKLQLINKKN
ncbi:MAG TPA: hypothetical protein VMZ29_16180 [Candidatus Bathyarchaeia archaeon]|nr:hypothetical protein [Candidatus Bathyarchaeia archaeon]